MRLLGAHTHTQAEDPEDPAKGGRPADPRDEPGGEPADPAYEEEGMARGAEHRADDVEARPGEARRPSERDDRPYGDRDPNKVHPDNRGEEREPYDPREPYLPIEAGERTRAQQHQGRTFTDVSEVVAGSVAIIALYYGGSLVVQWFQTRQPRKAPHLVL
jgi:hypothetical protein